MRCQVFLHFGCLSLALRPRNCSRAFTAHPVAPPHTHKHRITDPDIQSSVLEIMSTNVSTTFIRCPADPNQTLGIKLPFLVMIIKNLKKYFSFEVQVLDDKNVRRRFRASNYQVCGAPVSPEFCTYGIGVRHSGSEPWPRSRLLLHSPQPG